MRDRPPRKLARGHALVLVEVPLSLGKLATRVKRRRSERGYNIRQAAEEIGISPATLCRIENRKPATADSFLKVEAWMQGVIPLKKHTHSVGAGSRSASVAEILAMVLNDQPVIGRECMPMRRRSLAKSLRKSYKRSRMATS